MAGLMSSDVFGDQKIFSCHPFRIFLPLFIANLTVTLNSDDIYTLLQILNLTQALQDGKSPLQLVQMPVVTVERRKAAYGRSRIRNDSLEDTLTQKFSTRSPFFSWCWVRHCCDIYWAFAVACLSILGVCVLLYANERWEKNWQFWIWVPVELFRAVVQFRL